MKIRRPSLRTILLLLLGFCGLLVGLYSFARSDYFLRTVVLPELAKKLQCPISAEKVELSPLSSLSLTSLRIGNPSRPFLTAGSVELRYALFPLFSGRVIIDRLAFRNSSLLLKEKADGSLDIPCLPTEPSAPTQTDKPTEPSTPLEIHLSDIQLENASILFVKAPAAGQNGQGAQRRIELQKLRLLVPSLTNNGQGDISLRGALALQLAEDIDLHKGEFELTLHSQTDSRMLPKTFRGSLKFSGIEGRIKQLAFADDNLNLEYDGEWMPAAQQLRWKTLNVEATRDGQTFLSLSTSGAFSFSAKSGDIQLELKHLDQGIFRLLADVPPPLAELDLSGTVALNLKSPQAFDIDGSLTAARFLLPDTDPGVHPALNAEFKLEKGADGLHTKGISLKLNQSNDTAAQLALNGNVALPLESGASELSIKSEVLNVDSLIKIFSKKAAAAPKQPDAAPKSATKDGQDWSKPIPKNSSIKLTIDIAQLIRRPFDLRQLHAALALDKGKLDVSELRWKQDAAQIRWQSSLDLTAAEKPLHFSADIQDLDLLPLQKAAGVVAENQLAGRLHSLTASGAVPLSDLSQAAKRLDLDLQADFADIDLPLTLQSLPPFNIILLPIKVTANISKLVGGVLLPEALVKLQSAIGQQLEQAGQIRINRAELNFSLKDQSIDIKKAEFLSNLLPRFAFSGNIAADRHIDLIAEMGLGITQLRLPIIGTLDLPYPNVVTLVPQLVQGLGLGALDFLGSSLDKLNQLGPKAAYDRLLNQTQPLIDLSPKPPQVLEIQRKE
jgi:hypothetical protein